MTASRVHAAPVTEGRAESDHRPQAIAIIGFGERDAPVSAIAMSGFGDRHEPISVIGMNRLR